MDKQRIMELAQELASVPDNDTGYAKHYILEEIEYELNEKLEDKNMRILNGYSKAEQKELEYTKKNMSCNDFLHNITYFPATIECDSIKDKYDEADTDERISIIRDILDFYTDKAEFPEPKKYYVKLPKIGFPYLVQTDDGMELVRYLRSDFKEKFTEDEIKDIDPRYMAFAVPVEADDER